MQTRCLLLALSLATLFGCTPAPDHPPNIVFILIDDMGWTDAASFGSTFYETPNIDRLVREGMTFTRAYAAASICSPTRASILTGKHPVRLNQTDWIPGRGNHPDQQLLTVEDLNHLGLEHRTIAEVLKEAGYATGHVGKWHLGSGDAYLPESRGFDVNVAGNPRGSPPTYYYPYRRPIGDDTTNVYSLDDLNADGHDGEYLTDRLGEEAASFIAAHKNQPFFLHFSQYAVHTPLQARADLQAKYEAKSEPLPDSIVFASEGDHPVRVVQNHAVYAAMIESMDASVGRVLQALEENDLAGNTLVIFFSDNGGLATSEGWPTSNLPLRAGKGWLYEGGIREPMVVRWPGAVAPGAVCDVPVSSTDFFPTLAEVAGVTYNDTIDGVSLVPLLRQIDGLDRRALYWHYPHYSNQGGTPTGAIRVDAFKLIEFYEDQHVELYNLENDPGEQHDLALEQPETADTLRKQLATWRASLNARMPEPNPAYTGTE